VSDNNSTQGASDENQGGSGDSQTGSSADGATGGTQAADQLAVELEREKARTRSFQGELDREKQRAADLQAELDKVKDGGSGGEQSATGMTPEDVARIVRREQERASAMTAALETARKDFPNADPSVFADVSKYDSAEDLVAAARQSHDRLADHFKSREAALEKDIRERYEAVHGPLPAAPADDSEGQATGDPTIEQLSSMTQADLDALEKRAPGTIERVLASRDQMG
jgi:chromosome segregation ATPase